MKMEILIAIITFSLIVLNGYLGIYYLFVHPNYVAGTLYGFATIGWTAALFFQIKTMNLKDSYDR